MHTTYQCGEHALKRSLELLDFLVHLFVSIHNGLDMLHRHNDRMAVNNWRNTLRNG